MVFASHIFIFGFLPIFLAAYYLVPRKLRSLLILVASYAFYGWWRVDYLAVVLGISLVSYASAAAAITARSPVARKWAVAVGVSLILSALAYFKYAYFFLNAASEVAGIIGGPAFTVGSIILPIGISFLSFQSISYIVDVARGDAPPARNLVDFLAFSSLFPQLIAGPVLRYRDLADQFQDRVHSLAIFALGVRRFVIGLAMKLLVADTIAPLADRMFALSAPTMAEAWLGAGAYAIQLFFDFAGYSSMAIGLGLMIGFRFVENFNDPYTSHSITEFWQRWHISLSNWLRDYLYVPLGGNRHGALKTYRNLLLTMVLGGLWHGANWTFVLWGAWHGLALAIERMLGARGGARVWPKGLGWLITMLIVLIGWVLFRAQSVTHALQVYAGMAGWNGVSLSPQVHLATQPIELAALICGVGIAILGPRLRSWAPRYPAADFTVLMALMVITPIVLSARTHSPFLYFQF